MAQPPSRPMQRHCFRPVDLYGRKYDFERWRGRPGIEYMLAAIPRSGSTHLSMELWRTGVMGSPLEYTNPPFRDAARQGLGAEDDIVAYWEALKRVRTSPNGVFGFKMFIGNYKFYGENDAKLLREIAPGRVVLLTRLDLVEQAVSYSKAMRSGAWFQGIRKTTIPEYDADHIRSCMSAVQYQIDFWNELFALTDSKVHHVSYEELVDDRDAVVKRVADFLGVELDPRFAINLPRMRIQRDAESAVWVRRYREEESREEYKGVLRVESLGNAVRRGLKRQQEQISVGLSMSD